jgi:hypothetical protein
MSPFRFLNPFPFDFPFWGFPWGFVSWDVYEKDFLSPRSTPDLENQVSVFRPTETRWSCCIPRHWVARQCRSTTSLAIIVSPWREKCMISIYSIHVYNSINFFSASFFLLSKVIWFFSVTQIYFQNSSSSYPPEMSQVGYFAKSTLCFLY